MTWPNTLIIIGTLLLATGGVIATHGWNARTTAQQREGLIQAVAAELMVNLRVVSDSKFTETDAAKLEKYVVFPRSQTVALQGALASGQFLAERDRLLFTRLTELTELLLGFNNRLSITETQIARLSGPKIAEFRIKLRDGKTRNQLTEKLTLLGLLLMNEYGIDSTQRFFVDLEENAA